MSKLNSHAVTEIFHQCLFRPEELSPATGKPHGPFAAVEGITSNFGLHQERLQYHRPKLVAMIEELPEPFTSGGGWTFLNLCTLKNGEQWTGFHTVMEQFMVLCMGAGLAKYCMPREYWNVLPGGVPYISFINENQTH